MSAMEALERCRAAWERSQPQMFIELWPEPGLDETQGQTEHRTPSPGRGHGSLRLVEPVADPLLETGGGLTVGAEPSRDQRELTAQGTCLPAGSFPVPPARLLPRAMPGGSASLRNQTGPDAPPNKDARPAQEVTL